MPPSGLSRCGTGSPLPKGAPGYAGRGFFGRGCLYAPVGPAGTRGGHPVARSGRAQPPSVYPGPGTRAAGRRLPGAGLEHARLLRRAQPDGPSVPHGRDDGSGHGGALCRAVGSAHPAGRVQHGGQPDLHVSGQGTGLAAGACCCRGLRALRSGGRGQSHGRARLPHLFALFPADHVPQGA